MKLLAVASLLLFASPQQEDWVEEMKKMDDNVNQIQGPLYLLRSLRQEMLRALKALDESRLDLCDRHLLRLAHVSRPYNEHHADQVVALALSLRGEIRAEGVSRVAAIADDLKAGRAKEAEARIHDALATPYLATTYRAEFERLKEWLKKAPDPAAVEAEIARWRTMMPPGVDTGCATCKATGEADCTACLGGTLAQTCRNCSGTGQAACGLCAGKGKLKHSGYVGDLRFVIEKDFQFKEGKKILKFGAQRIFWTIKPCAGRGKCDIRSSSTSLDPNKPGNPPGNHTLDCTEIFRQIKLNVFNGRSKLYKSDKDKDILPVEQAKLFFAEYEKCAGGMIPCDGCDGKLTGPCVPCGGKGMRLGACSTCGGTGSSACPQCKASGDSSWLAVKVGPTRVPALGACLDTHVKALHGWRAARARERAKREDARKRLVEARKGIDPTARLTPEFVNVACPKCEGKSGRVEKCEDCWGAGRREYFPGMPVYEKYSGLKNLEEQIVQLSKASFGVSSDPIQLRIDDNSIDKDFKLPQVAKDPEPPKPRPGGGVGSGIGGTIAGLDEELQVRIAKADASHEEGKKAFEKAVAAGDDNEKRKEEAVKAKNHFRQAQALYSFVMEFLDDAGIDTPQELVNKVSINQQALKLARSMAF